MNDRRPTANPRPVYASEQLLVLDDFQAEQAFHEQARYQQNRWLYTAGVVAGLEVNLMSPPDAQPVAGKPAPLALAVTPGAAFDEPGRLLVLGGSGGQLRLDLPPYYQPGTTQSLVLGLLFGESPAQDNRVTAAPLLSLWSAAALPPDAVVLANVSVDAPPEPPPPTTGGDAFPQSCNLTVVIDTGVTVKAVLQSYALPRIPASQVDGLPAPDGPVAANRIHGTLEPCQLPRIPASQVDGLPAPDGPVAANRIQGTLQVAQLPRIPASQVDGLPAPDGPVAANRIQGTLEPGQLPRIPASQVDGLPAPDGPVAANRIQGTLQVAQLPRIPVSQVDGLPPPDAPVAAGRIQGMIPAGQVSQLADALQRLALLEALFYVGKVDLNNQTVQAVNATFVPGPGAQYNPQWGGWLLPSSGGGFKVAFAVDGQPSGPMRLRMYHCTSSNWPHPGYAPVRISLNGATIADNYDPATKHMSQPGADLTNYFWDGFPLPAALFRADNTLLVEVCSGAKTNYWIRMIEIVR
jgi:hypothetical protein